MRFIHWILAVCFFTASCDIVLIINVGGSLRVSQVFLILVCIAAGAHALQHGRILWPRGGTALTVWLLSQLLFLPLSGVISIGAQFFALLAFTIAGFFAVVQLYGRSSLVEPLMKIYLASYIFVGCFGLLQFALPLAGLPSPFVQQWLLHGRLARISGFSYEPSYYATYLMMGWIMLVELRISGARLTRGPLWIWSTAAVTLSLILSSSKTAWLFMLLEIFARVLPVMWRKSLSALRQSRAGSLVLRLPPGRRVLSAFLSLAFLAFIGVLGVRTFGKIFTADILLSGSGLAGTPAHSWIGRSEAAISTFDTFLDHPFVGRSLGGVPVYRAARIGITVHSVEEVRLYWGFPVILEVLVASGLIGIIPFLVFVYVNTVGVMRLATRRWPEERAKWLRALGRAMIFECLLLMQDQNLLRVYLWYHVSMVAVIAYHLEFAPAPEPSAAPAPRSYPLLEASPLT
ncbi:MAG: hypothetical protein M3N54_12120 [Acidobacteriota bacterium]|nr:hypothetical protein [Acidobacteriota bacterium]